MALLAFEAVDLLAFVALGLAGAVMLTLLVGIGAWLRARARAPEDGYWPGL